MIATAFCKVPYATKNTYPLQSPILNLSVDATAIPLIPKALFWESKYRLLTGCITNLLLGMFFHDDDVVVLQPLHQNWLVQISRYFEMCAEQSSRRRKTRRNRCPPVDFSLLSCLWGHGILSVWAMYFWWQF